MYPHLIFGNRFCRSISRWVLDFAGGDFVFLVNIFLTWCIFLGSTVIELTGQA